MFVMQLCFVPVVPGVKEPYISQDLDNVCYKLSKDV